MNLKTYCEDISRQAKTASRQLAQAKGEQKNGWLRHAADALESNTSGLLEANERDIAAAEANNLTKAQTDRLRLIPDRIRAMSAGLREVVALPDPVGRVLDSSIRPNGLNVQKISVPLGVIFFIYESRPNVTVDAASLAVKSGNAIILRGGKEAIHSNRALHSLFQESLPEFNLPKDAVQLVDTPDREAVGHLLKMDRCIDLVIPRGGEQLIRRVAAEATMPVLKHYLGNCHVYVDASADFETAQRIVINAKCQRTGVCNAAESLLVHRDIAELFLLEISRDLQENGVELRGCEQSRAIVSDMKPATDDDFAAEYLDLILSVKIVADVQDAIGHINRYGSGHTDAIVTKDLHNARRFLAEVDSSAVFVNASTRFNDGFEMGLGAEIGISTDKFHARGPCGLQELCSYKYIVFGDGQIRE